MKLAEPTGGLLVGKGSGGGIRIGESFAVAKPARLALLKMSTLHKRKLKLFGFQISEEYH